ncbi:MAG: DUF4847 family protein [Chitinophagales bacterium]|jgi:hypothetical protein|nr:DUF4847 family protein [Sphingobacteriales bacterium]MBK6889367.1 DUF4847 family protein [Sphingobacteriales bacterium]MBK8679765.1 DUF4847 family protein [Sphingobacteriales bacterium]MCC7056886.1 DUF4847 family protein [Chitinophagales bacterium]
MLPIYLRALFVLFFVPILLGFASGCCKDNDRETLIGSWQMTQIHYQLTGEVGHEPSNIARPIVLTFNDQNQITGQTIEHTLTANYQTDNDSQLEITNINATGTDQNLWGKKLLIALGNTSSYSRKCNELRIYYNKGLEYIKFERQE